MTGNTSNFLFWPGGFAEADISKNLKLTNINFESHLQTLASGFKCGLEFESDNFTPKNDLCQNTSEIRVQEFSEKTSMNLMAIIDEEANSLDFWAKPVLDSNAELKSKKKLITDTENILPSIDAITKEGSELEIPVLKITEEGKSSLQTEWAEQLDTTVSVTEFEKKVPDPAIKFNYELDNFQKQAIIKLEDDCNVFVAAHTSAGKTTVAEYAIALSQRHMTR